MAVESPGFHLLNSWKEVASYLGRGVRTVQRWEKLGLPVRRLGAGPRSPVVANARDLDRWLLAAASVQGTDFRQTSAHLVIRGGLGESIEQARRLRNEMNELRQSNWATVLRLTDSLSAVEKTLSLPSSHSEQAVRAAYRDESPPAKSRSRGRA
jgi:hypothetical protein